MTRRIEQMSRADALKVFRALIAAEVVLMEKNESCPDHVFEMVADSIEIIEREILK